MKMRITSHENTITRAFERVGLPLWEPLKTPVILIMGERGTHRQVVEAEVTIPAGECPAGLRYLEVEHARHVLVGRAFAVPLYWHGIVGGWAEVVPAAQ